MRAGLLGRKLGHSLSPQIHRLFGDYDYRLYEREPEDVAAFVRQGDIDFFNVTIPYKVTVAGLCDRLSPMAKRLGNVNFVVRDASGTTYGDNTDAYGVERLLDSVGANVRGRVCSVLGAGGAALTVKAVLEERGAESVSLVRRGETPAKDAWLIVNATPVGMFPDADGVRIDIRDYPDCAYVLDLVYNPSPTRLVREARACGKLAADGLVMLIGQAWRAYRLATDARRTPGEKADDGNLFLYGPPASGKSTLGRRLAAATGRPLVDLDAEVERAVHRTIADVFVRHGEPAFRRLEQDALRRVAAGRGQIVSLGGGALLDPESRQIAEASGRVVLLDCDEEELVRRSQRSSARPLLSGDATARLRALLSSRRDHYASFPNRIRLL